MEGRPIPRSYSDKYIPGQGDFDAFNNKNVEWFSAPSVKLFYIMLVLFAWGLLHVSGFFEIKDCWTITNILHGVVSHHLLTVQYLLANTHNNYSLIGNIYLLSLDQR